MIPRVDAYLPTSVKEMKILGWDSVDVVLFSGDAYVDHPSFGAAVIGRTLQAAGYRVAIVPQPNWQDDLRDFRKLVHRVCSLGSLPEPWTPWSIITLLLVVVAVTMPTPREGVMARVPTIRL